MYNLIIRRRAVIMAREAYIWYESQLEGLGESFLDELEISYKKLVKSPTSFGFIQNEFRSITMKKFPYIIIYEIIDIQIVVYAVFHSFRDPNKRMND